MALFLIVLIGLLRFTSVNWPDLFCLACLLVAIEVSHGVSRLTVLGCFAHVGLALAAGFGVDPLGGVFVQADDDD